MIIGASHRCIGASHMCINLQLFFSGVAKDNWYFCITDWLIRNIYDSHACPFLHPFRGILDPLSHLLVRSCRHTSQLFCWHMCSRHWRAPAMSSPPCGSGVCKGNRRHSSFQKVPDLGSWVPPGSAMRSGVTVNILPQILMVAEMRCSPSSLWC